MDINKRSILQSVVSDYSEKLYCKPDEKKLTQKVFGIENFWFYWKFYIYTLKKYAYW